MPPSDGKLARRVEHPKLFYGWVVVAITGLTLLVAFGTRLSFTVFFVALIDEYGWSRADTSLVFSVSMVVFAVASTPTGIAIDRWGARRVFGLGAAVLALGLFLSSQIQTLRQLAFAYGVIVGLGISILGLGPQAGFLSGWFRKRRGLAIGLAFAGTGIGTLTLTPTAAYLIREFGWRAAYRALAGLALAIVPVIFLFLRSNPASLGLSLDGAQSPETNPGLAQSTVTDWTIGRTMRSPAFWLVILASLSAIGPLRMLTVHQLAVAVARGFDQVYAASVIGIGGGVTAVSFVAFGALSDRIGRRATYSLGSISLLMAIVVLSSLASPERQGSLIVYALLAGIGEGARSSLVTSVASDLFHGPALGTINGVVGSAFGVGAAVMPWLAGRIYDQSGDYGMAFLTAAGAIVFSAIVLWIAPSFVERNNVSQNEGV
jgi:MFS family permease